MPEHANAHVTPAHTSTSSAQVREFLLLWLGIELSTGTINQCIHEAGRSVAPVEDRLVEELLASDLLHADETTWLIAGKPFWLWVFVTSTVTLYYITFRGNELVRNLLGEFKGWLMSDGYQVYRETCAELVEVSPSACAAGRILRQAQHTAWCAKPKASPKASTRMRRRLELVLSLSK